MKKFEDIYIIDDDAIAVFGLRRSLESIGAGSTIRSFENGRDALVHLRENMVNGANLPSLLFVDLHMPIIDGWGFLEEFHNLYPPEKALPLIYIMTSSIDLNDVEKAKLFGLENAYLVKPVTADTLKRLFA